MAFGLLLAAVMAFAQSNVVLKVYVAVIDADLNVKPVPRHVLLVRAANGLGDAARIVTGFDGRTEIKLTPGTYTLESDRPVEFQGHAYRWKETVTVQENAPTLVELSIDNAIDASKAPRPSGPPTAIGPVTPAPAGAAGPASRIPDLRGSWLGSYADSTEARLTIDRQDGAAFSGMLVVTTQAGPAPTEVQIEGKLSDRSVTITEVRVISMGDASTWGLGESAGSLQADGRHLSGTGKAGRVAYKWAFERRDPPSGAAAASVAGVRPSEGLDFRGTWDGTYAGFPAELRVDHQEGTTWSGTLVCTINAGKTPYEIQVSGKIVGLAIDMREVGYNKRGSGSWTLGSSSGAVSADGNQVKGAKKGTSYEWTFVRR